MTRRRDNQAPILSVTLDDCTVQTFSAGGPGGQNQNRRSTGVRVIHPPSGARGESREERSQLQNKKAAFRRMANSAPFQAWIKMRTGQDAVLRAQVEQSLTPDKIKTEIRVDGAWVEVDRLPTGKE